MLLKAITFTLHCTDSDNLYSRYVQFCFGNGTLTLAATDVKRLAVAELAVAHGLPECEFLVPTSEVRRLLAGLTDEDLEGGAFYYGEDGRLSFVTPACRVVSMQSVTANFPNWRHRLAAQPGSAPAVTVGINGRYWLEALQAFDGILPADRNGVLIDTWRQTDPQLLRLKEPTGNLRAAVVMIGAVR